MADSTIGSLPEIEIMQNADLFVLEQNGTAKKLSGQQLSSYIDRQIISVTVVERAATETYTATYNRNTGELIIGIPRGVGISNISNPVVSGLNKTYTIIFDKPASASVATTKNFTVKDGNGIVSIEAIDDAHVHGGMDHYRINFDEGSPFDFYVYNGQDGYGTPGTAVPLMDGTAAVGTANMYSRQDHVHPTDTTRQRKLKEVTVNISASATEAQIGSLTDTDITANTRYIHAEIADPTYQLDDWTVKTYNSAPQLRVTGISSGATTLKLILAEVS
jgi:anti-sigma28 factor (negative regulator of flagellin synthesis)